MTPEISELVQKLHGCAEVHSVGLYGIPVEHSIFTTAANALTHLSERIADAEKVLTDPAAFHLHALRNDVLSRMNALHIAGATDYDSVKDRLAEAESIIHAVMISYPVAAGTSKYGYEESHDGYGSIRQCRLYLERHNVLVSGSTEGGNG